MWREKARPVGSCGDVRLSTHTTGERKEKELTGTQCDRYFWWWRRTATLLLLLLRLQEEGWESGKWGGPQTPVWRRESNQMWENRLKVSLRYITTFHLKQVSFFLFFLNHSGHVFVSYFLMDGIDSLWDGAAPEQKEVRHSFVNLWDACLVSRQVVSFISKEIRVTEWTLCRVGQSLVIAAGGGQADDAATLFGLAVVDWSSFLRYRFRTTHFFWHPFSFSC